MKRALIIGIASVLTLVACQSTTTTETAAVAQKPASAQDMSLARKAISVCGATLPSVQNARSTLISAGFEKLSTKYDSDVAKRTSAIYRAAGSGVVVAIADQGKETVCIVQVASMAPEQVVGLAQPLVKKFGAKTNAERGQGLSNKVYQAWGSLNSERVVFIAAQKASKVMEERHPAVRLIYIPR